MRLGLSRRQLALLVLGAVLAAAAYLVFGATDERRVLRVARELAAALSSQPGDTAASRGRRVHAALAGRTTQTVIAHVPELGGIQGRGALEEVLANLAGVPLELSIDASTVQVDRGKRRARAVLAVTALFRYPGEERRDARSVTLDLTRVGDDWRVTRIEVGEASRVEPEARP